ncbi:HGxxPAAW family protein [Psychromicrobium sp. YIM B11713]|uniref:HGxxPAAW family protein n=1 Tax=Psychromicrobium sp. YIM B11713 TaxID=3145233 RepID=UPI00374EBFE3
MSPKTVNREASVSPDEVAHAADGHGNSPAAWTCVLVMLAGALLSSIAFVIASTPLFIAGLVVMVVGLILGLVLRAAGYGVGGSKIKNSGH